MAARKRAIKSRENRPGSATLVPEQVERSILVVRGHKVLLDEQLAAFYGVETRALIQAMKRNINRFRRTSCFS